MLERILIELITILTAWLYNRALDKYKSIESVKNDNSEIDIKAEQVKKVSSEIFNGNPVTKEDRDKIKSAMRNFLHPDSSGGL